MKLPSATPVSINVDIFTYASNSTIIIFQLNKLHIEIDTPLELALYSISIIYSRTWNLQHLINENQKRNYTMTRFGAWVIVNCKCTMYIETYGQFGLNSFRLVDLLDILEPTKFEVGDKRWIRSNRNESKNY